MLGCRKPLEAEPRLMLPAFQEGTRPPSRACRIPDSGSRLLTSPACPAKAAAPSHSCRLVVAVLSPPGASRGPLRAHGSALCFLGPAALRMQTLLGLRQEGMRGRHPTHSCPPDLGAGARNGSTGDAGGPSRNVLYTQDEELKTQITSETRREETAKAPSGF